MRRAPESLEEHYGRGVPEIRAQVRGEPAEDDNGCPREGQRAEAVASPLHERDGAHEAVQPPLSSLPWRRRR